MQLVAIGLWILLPSAILHFKVCEGCSSSPPHVLAVDEGECAICLDPIAKDAWIRPIACGHAFHADCLDRWLDGYARAAVCPLCQQPL